MKPEEKAKPTKREQFAQLRSDFTKFLYNKEGDEPAVVMGRTALSWGKIGLFFLVYYACLTAFFAAMFAIAFSTIPEIKDGPKYTSFISDKPLLLVYPENGVGSWEKDNINGSIKNAYETFLDGYKDTQCYLKDKCDPNGGYRPAGAEKQCGFDLASLGPCNRNDASGFGYNHKSPCLYFRLSKIYDWKPKPNENNSVELDCKAEGGGNTQIKYYPSYKKSFPISFWPFRGESAFRTPIAAIQVNVTGNTKAVKIKCKAIADNIELSSTYKLKRGAHGQVEFTVAAPPA